MLSDSSLEKVEKFDLMIPLPPHAGLEQRALSKELDQQWFSSLEKSPEILSLNELKKLVLGFVQDS